MKIKIIRIPVLCILQFNFHRTEKNWHKISSRNKGKNITNISNQFNKIFGIGRRIFHLAEINGEKKNNSKWQNSICIGFTDMLRRSHQVYRHYFEQFHEKISVSDLGLHLLLSIPSKSCKAIEADLNVDTWKLRRKEKLKQNSSSNWVMHLRCIKMKEKRIKFFFSFFHSIAEGSFLGIVFSNPRKIYR